MRENRLSVVLSQMGKDRKEGGRGINCNKAAPVRVPLSLFKVEQTISQFYSESKVYLIKHNSRRQASELGCVLNIVIGCDNPCEPRKKKKKKNESQTATCSTVKVPKRSLHGRPFNNLKATWF